MCGIAGVFDLRGQRPVSPALLQAMNDAQAHRGPDGEGVYTAPGVGLGQRRLSIIALANGRQPLANEDGTVWVVFNGEIYNFAALRAELLAQGHRFATPSDTEVLVHGWEAWGEALLPRLRGMFAFALWDARAETLFLARDRLGKKPLYYTETTNGWLLVASELKALRVHPALDHRIDPAAIEDYLAFGYIPEPRSVYRAVRKLEAGHCARLDRRTPHGLHVRPWWDVTFTSPALPVPEAEEALREKLLEAVRLRLVADVPVGAFLSGGVDSGAVVAGMAQASESPPVTCSIAFREPEFDESAAAGSVADRLGTRHHVSCVETTDASLIDRLVATFDEPFADSSALPTFRLCEMARRHVKVALSGDGGDEAFAGYRRHRWHVEAARWRRLLPSRLRAPLFGALAASWPQRQWWPRALRARATFENLARDPIEAYRLTVNLLPDATRWQLYSPAFRRALQGYHAREVFARHLPEAPEEPLARVQYLDLKTYLPGDILVKVDRASMAHGLEVRAPLLDHELVDWAARLAPAQRLHDGVGKFVLKRAVAPWLPPGLAGRPKQGFGVPLAAWFRTGLRERLHDALTGPALAGTGLFEPEALARLFNEHQSRQRDHSAALWALLMLEGFFRQQPQASSAWC